jgi:hypothetical protein
MILGTAWMLIPFTLLALIPFFLVKERNRWWPGAYGWAMVIFSVGVMAADGFRTFAAVGISIMFFGFVLGFAGVMSGPNSPAK